MHTALRAEPILIAETLQNAVYSDDDRLKNELQLGAADGHRGVSVCSVLFVVGDVRHQGEHVQQVFQVFVDFSGQ